jgi:hypothetical protein
VHPTLERLETAFAGLDAYNQERAKPAEEQAKKRQGAANVKTLAQTA